MNSPAVMSYKISGSAPLTITIGMPAAITLSAASSLARIPPVPRALPALMRAGKVQNRARRVGFDWPDVSGAMQALDSETMELKQAVASGDTAAMEEELGDLLFSAVNVSRFIDIDAEQALTGATDKFIRRFTVVEQLAAERGVDLASASLEDLDRLWDEAKRHPSA